MFQRSIMRYILVPFAIGLFLSPAALTAAAQTGQASRPSVEEPLPGRIADLQKSLADIEASLTAINEKLAALAVGRKKGKRDEEAARKANELLNRGPATWVYLRGEFVPLPPKARNPHAANDEKIEQARRDLQEIEKHRAKLRARRDEREQEQSALLARIAAAGVTERGIDQHPIYLYSLVAAPIGRGEALQPLAQFLRGVALALGEFDRAVQDDRSAAFGNLLAAVRALEDDLKAQRRQKAALGEMAELDALYELARELSGKVDTLVEVDRDLVKAREQEDDALAHSKRARLSDLGYEMANLAIRLDRGIAAQVAQWKMSADTSKPLPPPQLPGAQLAAKPRERALRGNQEQNRIVNANAGIGDIFPLGSGWSGYWSSNITPRQETTGKITDVGNQTATMRFHNDFGAWDLVFELVDNEVQLEEIHGIGNNGNWEFSNMAISAATNRLATKGKLTFQGTWDARHRRSGQQNNNEKVRFEFSRDDFEPKEQAGAVRRNARNALEIDEIFPKGSTWGGNWSSSRVALQQVTGVIKSVVAGTALMRFANDHGQYDIEFRLSEGNLVMSQVVGIGKNQSTKFSNLRISAPLAKIVPGQHIELTGQWDNVNHNNNDARINVEVRFEFVRDVSDSDSHP